MFPNTQINFLFVLDSTYKWHYAVFVIFFLVYVT